jgi:hypothetical protein
MFLSKRITQAPNTLAHIIKTGSNNQNNNFTSSMAMRDCELEHITLLEEQK